MNPKVDFFFTKAKQWHDEYEKLRLIVLDSGLTEELKWGVPCYTLNKKNVVLIHGFKEYCALLFMKGALLSDPKKILIQQTENVQSARQVRFTKTSEIIKQEPAIRKLIKGAIEAEQKGLKVELKKTTDYQVPEAFQQKLTSLPGLKKAFETLTPGRQRAYLFHFSQAKLAKTRESRVEQAIPRILDGKGLED